MRVAGRGRNGAMGKRILMLAGDVAADFDAVNEAVRAA